MHVNLLYQCLFLLFYCVHIFFHSLLCTDLRHCLFFQLLVYLWCTSEENCHVPVLPFCTLCMPCLPSPGVRTLSSLIYGFSACTHQASLSVFEAENKSWLIDWKKEKNCFPLVALFHTTTYFKMLREKLGNDWTAASRNLCRLHWIPHSDSLSNFRDACASMCRFLNALLDNKQIALESSLAGPFTGQSWHLRSTHRGHRTKLWGLGYNNMWLLEAL